VLEWGDVDRRTGVPRGPCFDEYSVNSGDASILQATVIRLDMLQIPQCKTDLISVVDQASQRENNDVNSAIMDSIISRDAIMPYDPTRMLRHGVPAR